MLERMPERLRKPLLYAVCGGSGVLFDIAVFGMLLQLDVWYQAANLAGYTSGTLLSFVLNRAVTFKTKDAPVRRLGLFLLVAAIGYSLSTILLMALVEGLGVEALVAKAATLVVVVLTQYTLNSLITFRADKPELQRQDAE